MRLIRKIFAAIVFALILSVGFYSFAGTIYPKKIEVANQYKEDGIEQFILEVFYYYRDSIPDFILEELTVKFLSPVGHKHEWRWDRSLKDTAGWYDVSKKTINLVGEKYKWPDRYNWYQWNRSKIEMALMHETGHSVFFIGLTEDQRQSFFDLLPYEFNRDYDRYNDKDFGWQWDYDGIEAFAEVYRYLYTETYPRRIRVALELTPQIEQWFKDNFEPMLEDKNVAASKDTVPISWVH